MNRHWEDASPIRSVHFDRATHTLRIEFQSGAVFDFADVPEHVCDELTHSTDRDAYFAENVQREFAATRAGDVDLAELANELREDAILGPPHAEEMRLSGVDDLPDADSERSADVGRTHHTWVVDVIDDDSAAVEIDGRQITPLPRWLLPADAHDGDVLRVTHTRSGMRSTVSIEVDRSATRLAFDRSADQMRNAPPSGFGDIRLT